MDIKTHYKYVIIGAGISALQAALILAENQHQFVILQASQRFGGRICSLTLQQGLKDCPDTYEWLQKVKHYPIQCGGTWICQDHAFMLNYVKQFNLNLTTQYYEGRNVLAQSPQKYHPQIKDYYNNYRDQIVKLVKQLEQLSQKYEHLRSKQLKKTITQIEQKELNEFYEKYDKKSALQYLKQHVKDEFLAQLLANQATTLQCCHPTEYSVLQLFADGGQPLANVKFYIGLQNANIDGFRLTEGMIRICQNLIKSIQKRFDEQGSLKNINDLIKLNSPVAKINNDRDLVEVITKDGIVYTCEKVITCLPVATFHKIQFQAISESKKILVENQTQGTMTRMAMVFKEPFWRKTHAGYVSFSQNFHMNQIVQLTPEDKAYGILAFVFMADGYEKWKEEIHSECKHLQGEEYKLKFYQINKQKAMKIIADIYLKGDINNPHLKDVAIFAKSLSDYEYIKSTYQAVTATETAYKINKLSPQEISKKPQDDEKNIIVLGSDFSDEFCGYMEGGIRIARNKIYKLCGKKDPLQHLGVLKAFSQKKP